MFHRIFILVTLCVYCKGIINVRDPVFRRDYTYSREANGWFKLHYTPLPWPKARFICDYEGAVLASPLNNQIQAGIAKFLKDQRSSPDVIYSGTSARIVPGLYQSIEGVKLAEMPVPWAEKEPGLSEGCLVFYSSTGTMGIKKCTDEYPYLCYKEYQKLEMTRNECGTFDKEYRRFNGSKECYKYHPDRTNWAEAYKICYAEGGRLAVNSNKDISRYLYLEKDAHNVYVGFKLYQGTWWDITGKLMDPVKTEALYSKLCGAKNKDGNLVGPQCYESYPFLCEKAADYIV